MERARHLLSAPSATIEDVARAVGFSNVDSFIKAFKRSSGLSPAAWRRRERPGVDREQG
jgi:AraC-like DNA-binding protein